MWGRGGRRKTGSQLPGPDGGGTTVGAGVAPTPQPVQTQHSSATHRLPVLSLRPQLSRSRPGPGSHATPRGRACCLPGGQVRPHPSSNGVSPSAPRPPARLRPGPGRHRTHRTRPCTRSPRSSPRTSPAWRSWGPSSPDGPRPEPSRAPPPPKRSDGCARLPGLPGLLPPGSRAPRAPPSFPRGGARRRHSHSPAGRPRPLAPGSRPPEGARVLLPPPSPGEGVIAKGRWRCRGRPAPPRHALGCRFGVPHILRAVFCQDVSEPPSLRVWFDVTGTAVGRSLQPSPGLIKPVQKCTSVSSCGRRPQRSPETEHS